MNQINKIILCGLLLCLLRAAGKEYGQEVKPGTVLWEFLSGFHVNSSPAIGSDGTSMSGHMTYYVYATDGKTGAEKWKFVTGGHLSPTMGQGT